MVAVVAGASGLTGSFLLNELNSSPKIDSVIVFVRKPLQQKRSKVKEVLFKDDFETFIEQIPSGALFFCCLGTTIKRAGSKEKFSFVDVTLVNQFIALAQLKTAQAFVLQSSLGAGKPGQNFYLTCKQQTEHTLLNSRIARKYIVRPSLLIGKRSEMRLAEGLAQLVMPLFDWMFFGPIKRYRSIRAERVAQAMLLLALEEIQAVKILESEEIQERASGR